ncbi:SRPBCC family protein [Flaviaesturariibacter amylovorans]|uniref:SRPBCC family protein n=1 Tax=Flaviaesturariibacter amylovorans TaxID=1084520 RepID=A0ABP8HVJ0_9BACT
MTISTTQTYPAPAAALWPLLFGSRMDRRHPCRLLCGLPKPVECRLAEAEGGVGKTRECVSDKGVIRQEITAWVPNELLAFELKETNLYFGPCVNSIRERFELKALPGGGTSITRTTDFRIRRPFRLLLALPMAIGLKNIHWYVFRNWKQLSEEARA